MVNSVAILNEERFLNRSKILNHNFYCFKYFFVLVGWGKDSISQNSQSNQAAAYGAHYDQNANSNVSVKHQLITLISATRTLMRSNRQSCFQNASVTNYCL